MNIMHSQENTSLNINIDNYSGPLEVLLDLAKSQKVNLEEISITQLADQFIDFINKNKKTEYDRWIPPSIDYSQIFIDKMDQLEMLIKRKT